MSTVCVHAVISTSIATAADAHIDSGGLHITAHLFHTVQDTSGQWCVERVMERETLINNTEYQERLREAKIKGVPARGNRIEDTPMIQTSGMAFEDTSIMQASWHRSEGIMMLYKEQQQQVCVTIQIYVTEFEISSKLISN